MPLKPDDTVCFCFHVSLRKIETFCRRERPQVASQISECLSAGTGCGWCVPMLRRIHQRECGQSVPWWRQLPAGEAATAAAEQPADAARCDETVDAAEYAAGRQGYIAQGRGTPPNPEV